MLVRCDERCAARVAKSRRRAFVIGYPAAMIPRVLQSPCYVISDTHLGAAPQRVEMALLDFLHALQGHAASLVINGDLFDFWFEWRTVIPRHGFRVLAALADLRETGVPILWMAGNHDGWGGSVLREDVGVEYHTGPWQGSLAGWRARVEHGDGLRPKRDRPYRMLRTVIRHPMSIRLFRWLHPDLGSRLAMGSSHASRNHGPRSDGAELRQIALEKLDRTSGLELLIYGHSHVATLERARGGGIYANPGTWLDAPTFLTVTRDRVELCRWNGSAEGECLDSLDRPAQEALTQP